MWVSSTLPMKVSSSSIFARSCTAKKHKKDTKDKKGQPDVKEHHDEGITGKVSSSSGPVSTQRRRPRPSCPAFPVHVPESKPEKITKQKKDLGG